MLKKFFFIILLFYVLTLLQGSFFPYFGINGYVLNFVLILTILINLFENSEEKFGIFSALIGGFFLDIFSGNFIGFHILILVGLSLFIKFILRNYVSLPVWKNILKTKK